MSIQRVTFTTAREKFAPPSKEIDLAVIGETVFITVYNGSSEDLKDGRQKEYEVPEIALGDLMRALGAFGAAIQAWGIGHEQARTTLSSAEAEQADREKVASA